MKMIPKNTRGAINGTFAPRDGAIVDSEGDYVAFKAGDFIVTGEDGLPAYVMSGAEVAKWYERAKTPGRKRKEANGKDERQIEAFGDDKDRSKVEDSERPAD